MQHVGAAGIAAQSVVLGHSVHDQNVRARLIREAQQVLVPREDHHKLDALVEQGSQRRLGLLGRHGDGFGLVGVPEELARRAVVLGRQRGTGKAEILRPFVVARDRGERRVIDPQNGRADIDRMCRGRPRRHHQSGQQNAPELSHHVLPRPIHSGLTSA